MVMVPRLVTGIGFILGATIPPATEGVKEFAQKAGREKKVRESRE
jgi:hypothetical protein